MNSYLKGIGVIIFLGLPVFWEWTLSVSYIDLFFFGVPLGIFYYFFTLIIQEETVRESYKKYKTENRTSTMFYGCVFVFIALAFLRSVGLSMLNNMNFSGFKVESGYCLIFMIALIVLGGKENKAGETKG